MKKMLAIDSRRSLQVAQHLNHMQAFSSGMALLALLA